MHVVALGAPAVAAPGEAVLGEGIVNIAALGDGVRINIRRPVGAAGRRQRTVRVDGSFHVLVRVDINCGALRVLAGAPRVAAYIIDRELLGAVEDLLKDGLIDGSQRSVYLQVSLGGSLGNVIKNGVPVAIVGNTNVGKSTLLNALLREDRAIVSDIAGTTRDVIEDTINLNGITFRFIDTAGIRATSDEVENIGIERTFAKIGQASVVLLLTDLNRGVESFEEYYHQVKSRLTSDAKLIIVLNKTDQVEDLLTPQETIRLFTSGEEIIPISARTGANLDRLIQELTRTVNLNTLNTSDVIVSNVRHYEALRNARTAIERVNEGLESGLSGEFISQDIRECLHYLGEITGEITTDEVLGNIFKNFCIGK